MPTIRAKPPRGALFHRANRLSKGLTGAWLLTEQGGSKAADSVGTATGTLTNFALSASVPGWGVGLYGRCLTFDGSDDQVPLGPAASGSASRSYGILFRMRSLPASNACLLTSGTSPDGLAFEILVSSAGGIYIHNYNGQTTSATGLVGTAKGYLALATYDGVTETMYLDGNVVGTRTVTLGTPASTLRIGSQGTYPPAISVPAADVFGVWQWNRSLSSKDAATFAADPFRMFRRRSVPVPVRSSGGAGATNRLLNLRRRAAA